MKLNILGAEYAVLVKKYEEDDAFEKNGICGYCDGHVKEIVVCDLKTYMGFDEADPRSIDVMQKEVLRHEIIHAFFDESGLMESSHVSESGWTQNEEMVDWFALQGPKIFKAWKEAGAI